MHPSRAKSNLLETPNSKTSHSALSRSGLLETSNKTTPATPRVSKLARTPSKTESADSPSPRQSSRPSVDRSPRSVESKPAIERRSPKTITPTDKQPRVLKSSGLQAQLAEAQEELKKAKERLASIEKETTQVLEELKEAKKSAAEANEKLEEALAAEKRAQENSEIEKFRADELEQAAIEAAQKKEDEWQKELESIHNQHAIDVSSLLSTTQELQRVKQELTMTIEAKNAALGHANDAMKIAEINAEKVEVLSLELTQLKGSLDSKVEKTNEASELVDKLNAEVDSLKSELTRAQVAEKKVVELEALVEALNIEVTDAKQAESDAGILMDEWKKKSELLGARVEEAIQSEKSALDSLASSMQKLEECNCSLQDAESEIASLKGKVESLETEIASQKMDLDESSRHLEMSKQEVIEMEQTLEVLKSELQNLEEEKRHALDDAKQAASTVQKLLEERSTILKELEVSRDEGEKSKKAMEGLASALHEMSGEARESQERLLIKQAEVEEVNSEIERLKMDLKTKEESYEVMLNEAKGEISCLKTVLERSEQEMNGMRSELNEKELNSANAIERSQEELNMIQEELSKIIRKLEGAEAEAKAAKEEGTELLVRLKQAELKVNCANEAVEEAKAENLHLKERLLDKENELQSITQENDDLRAREDAALEKVKELSALLEEATVKKMGENNELSNSEKEYDFLPKATEIPDDNPVENMTEKPKPEEPLGFPEVYNGGERNQREESGNGHAERRETVDEEATWENCNVSKDSPPEEEPEQESVDDDVQSKVDGDSFEQTNGLSSENVDNGAGSPDKQHDPKKKKPLFRKFGSLLKKKSNQK